MCSEVPHGARSRRTATLGRGTKEALALRHDAANSPRWLDQVDVPRRTWLPRLPNLDMEWLPSSGVAADVGTPTGDEMRSRVFEIGVSGTSPEGKVPQLGPHWAEEMKIDEVPRVSR